MREQTPDALAAAALLRQKAFTLAVKTYGALRRGVLYLRYDEGDADRIAPSLYAGRGGRGRREGEDAAEPSPAVSPTGPGAAPSAPAPAPFPAPFAPPGNDIPPGMPGASPFLRE